MTTNPGSTTPDQQLDDAIEKVPVRVLVTGTP